MARNDPATDDMLIVILTSLVLIAVTTMGHYEVLRALHTRLPVLPIPRRFKLLVVIFGTFFAHAAEVMIYAAAIYVLVNYAEVGQLLSADGPSPAACLYLSVESYTSLGIGDIKPVGPIRLVVGVEALHGLLLIGWSASYLYMAMERFWSAGARPHSH